MTNLTPADISEGVPDERAVMTYVSSYYHTFTGLQKVGSISFITKVLDIKR